MAIRAVSPVGRAIWARWDDLEGRHGGRVEAYARCTRAV